MQKKIFNLNLIFLFSFLFYTNLNSPSYSQFLAPEYPTGTQQQQYTLPSFPQNIPTYSPPAYTAPQIPTYMPPPPPPEPTTTTSPSLIPSSPLLEEQTTSLEPEAPTESQPEQETITTSEPPHQEQTVIQPEPPPSEETKVFQEPPVLPESASNTANQVLVTIFSSNCSNSDCSGCNSEAITPRIGSAYENCCRAKPDGTGCN